MSDLPIQAPRGESLWTDAWRRLRRNHMAVAGGIVVILFVILCAGATWIAPYGFSDINVIDKNQGPSLKHWMGTDELGRDLLSKILYGGRISFAVGILATLVSVVIGVIYGAISGFAGGRTDNIMMRIVDILYSLPYMFIVIILMTLFERSLMNLFIALGAVSWLSLARIVRGQVLSLKEREFVLAARAMGARNGRIVFRHIIPNVLGPVIVYSTLEVPGVMLSEAFLSFLGLGVQPPATSWGLLASEGANSITTYPWLIIFPGLALAIVLFSMNFLGDGLRDALDPQMRK